MFMEIIEDLKAVANSQSTETIVSCIRLIGGSMEVPTEERLARAALIEVYKERAGDEAAEALMDEIGM